MRRVRVCATEVKRTGRRASLSVGVWGRKGRLWQTRRGTEKAPPLHPCRRRRAACGTVRWPACGSARGQGGARAELAGGDPTAALTMGAVCRRRGRQVSPLWRVARDTDGSTRRSCEETWARAGRSAALFLFVFSLFALRTAASLVLRCVLETRRPAAAFLARPKGPARVSCFHLRISIPSPAFPGLGVGLPQQAQPRAAIAHLLPPVLTLFPPHTPSFHTQQRIAHSRLPCPR